VKLENIVFFDPIVFFVQFKEIISLLMSVLKLFIYLCFNWKNCDKFPFRDWTHLFQIFRKSNSFQ
jgi:hypothetical protein